MPKIVSGDPKSQHSSKQFDWNLGWDFAADILEGIDFMTKDINRKKYVTDEFQVYWAGNILRIDIKKTAIFE